MSEVSVSPLLTWADAVAMRHPGGLVIYVSSAVPLWLHDSVVAELQRAMSHLDGPDTVTLPLGWHATRLAAEPVITLRDAGGSIVTPRRVVAAVMEVSVVVVSISSGTAWHADEDVVADPDPAAYDPFSPCDLGQDVDLDYWLPDLALAV